MSDKLNKSKKFLGVRKSLESIRTFVESNLLKTPLEKDDLYKIILAVDEACANVITHNYEIFKKSNKKHITLTVKETERQVHIIIEDEGEEFNPLDISDPDLNEHLVEYRKHGLGIYLIRRLVDEVIYQGKKGKGNYLELIKYTDIEELM